MWQTPYCWSLRPRFSSQTPVIFESGFAVLAQDNLKPEVLLPLHPSSGITELHSQ